MEKDPPEEAPEQQCYDRTPGMYKMHFLLQIEKGWGDCPAGRLHNEVWTGMNMVSQLNCPFGN